MSEDRSKWTRIVRRAVGDQAWPEGSLVMSRAIADAVERQLMEDIDEAAAAGAFHPKGDGFGVELCFLGFERPESAAESANRRDMVNKLSLLIEMCAEDVAHPEAKQQAEQLVAIYEALHGVKL